MAWVDSGMRRLPSSSVRRYLEWIAFFCMAADTSLKTGSIRRHQPPLIVQSKKYFGIAILHHDELDVAGIFWKKAIAVEFRFTLGTFNLV
jgi:hypothetical protein